MNLRSDNGAPVLPEIREALLADMARGTRETGGRHYDLLLDRELDSAFAQVFGRPVISCATASGTGSNCVAIATLARAARPPRIVCHREAHVSAWEEGAVLRITGTPRFDALPGDHGKIDADGLAGFLESQPDGSLAGGVVTLTNPTEVGTLYKTDEIGRLAALAHRCGMSVHLDGARFAMCVSSLGISAARFVEETGIDGISFGGTKVGALAAEAVVLFDPSDGMRERLARVQRTAGQKLAKRRFIQVQLLCLLQDDLWLQTAARQRSNCAAFAALMEERVRRRLRHPVETNQIFIAGNADLSRRFLEAGIGNIIWDAGTIRFVFDHGLNAADIGQAAARVNEIVRIADMRDGSREPV